MKSSELKQQLKKVNIGNREQQRILLILRNHPPQEELKSIVDVLDYVKDFY